MNQSQGMGPAHRLCLCYIAADSGHGLLAPYLCGHKLPVLLTLESK